MGRRVVGFGIGLPFGSRIGEGVSYLLRATFNANDQVFVDAEVLNTVAKGVTAGQLTVVDTTVGVLQIINNQCDVTPPLGVGLGWFSQAFTRSLGLGLLVNWNGVTAVLFGSLGWFNDQAIQFTEYEQTINVFAGNAGMRPFQGGAGPGLGFEPLFSTSTDYQFAFILGGYDVNGVPWRTGEVAASYLLGSSFYLIGGAFSNWTLIWKQKITGLATLYAGFDANNFDGTLDDFRVPDVDLSAVLQPANVSTFTALNGTSLDAITPEVGGTWTEQSGNWDVQSNRANPDGAAIATVASGEADAMVECIVNGGTSDNPAIVLRLSDTSNLWYLQADRANNLLELHEVNATVDTVRASAAFTINNSTDYDLRAVPDGSTILGYIDFATEIKYTAATLNQTEENHGIRSETTLGQFDNFAVFPRTAVIYDTEFNAV